MPGEAKRKYDSETVRFSQSLTRPLSLIVETLKSGYSREAQTTHRIRCIQPHRFLLFYKIFVDFLGVIAYNLANRNNVSIGLVVRPRSINGGEVPRFFQIICCELIPLKELSIFIDESGDFGEYEAHSPYYIIIMVFHV